MCKIVSIDVGYSSLGLVCANAANFVVQEVQLGDKLDIRYLPCVNSCTLQHSNNVVDRVAHLVAYYEKYFQEADVVLIEAQPLSGLVHVQALLYHRFRLKARLISPNAMHKHFDLPPGDYEARKIKVVEMATPYLCHLHSFRKLHRKHDVCDAMMMILFYLAEQQERHVREMEMASKKQRALDNRAKTDVFESFRFHKDKDRIEQNATTITGLV